MAAKKSGSAKSLKDLPSKKTVKGGAGSAKEECKK